MVEISVIIPIFNSEKYLRDCLDSVIGQTFTDIEIICINDGSTDASSTILEEYGKSDERIRIFNQENGGSSSARNAGLDNANGKYIYFADSDDYLEADTLEKCYNLSEEKNLDLLIFKLVAFNNETGERNYTYSDMPFLLDLGDRVFGFEDIRDDLLKIDVTLYTKLFRSELLENVRFEEGLIFEDNLFYIEYIFRAKRIYFCDECLYNRRVHEHSLISSASKNYMDIIPIFNKINDRILEFGYYDEFKERLFMRKMDGIDYRYGLINPEYKSLFFDEIKRDFISKYDEYQNEIDFTMVDARSKAIFDGFISSDSPQEYDLSMKIYSMQTKVNNLKRENAKYRRENRRLKAQNESIISSNSWKITEPLRKVGRFK